MRFGAIVEGDQVKFTVWARDAKSIDVVIYTPSGEEVIPLTRQENGVFKYQLSFTHLLLL
jgi:1,4-alpha-glucan branching enzyme